MLIVHGRIQYSTKNIYLILILRKKIHLIFQFVQFEIKEIDNLLFFYIYIQRHFQIEYKIFMANSNSCTQSSCRHFSACVILALAFLTLTFSAREDGPERHDLKLRFLLFILHSFSLFLGGKGKE